MIQININRSKVQKFQILETEMHSAHRLQLGHSQGLYYGQGHGHDHAVAPVGKSHSHALAYYITTVTKGKA